MQHRVPGGERVYVHEGGDDERRERGVQAGEGGAARHGGRGETMDVVPTEVPFYPHKVLFIAGIKYRQACCVCSSKTVLSTRQLPAPSGVRADSSRYPREVPAPAL